MVYKLGQHLPTRIVSLHLLRQRFIQFLTDAYLSNIMASELQTPGGLGAGEKKGLYKELRQNPYLLGLSAVSHPSWTS